MNKKELVQYYCKCCSDPAVSIWIEAIKNSHFQTWPGLSKDIIEKYPPKSISTVKPSLTKTKTSNQPKSLQTKMTNLKKIETTKRPEKFTGALNKQEEVSRTKHDIFLLL